MPANAAEDVSAKTVAAFEDSVVVCDEENRKMEQFEEDFEEKFEEEFEEEVEEEFEEERERERKRIIERLEQLRCLRDRLIDLEKSLEDGAISPEEYDAEARKAKAEADAGERQREQQEEKCWNCDGKFSPDHQCYS